MLVRSENRRVSHIRMAKKSFEKVRQLHESLTSDEIKAAEEEYRETRTTTNSKVAYLLRELSAFGHGQHMSNLVVVDRLTKGRHYEPLTSLDVDEVYDAMNRRIFCVHGLPLSIVSDRGKQMVSRLWTRVCQRRGIKIKL